MIIYSYSFQSIRSVDECHFYKQIFTLAFYENQTYDNIKSES